MGGIDIGCSNGSLTNKQIVAADKLRVALIDCHVSGLKIECVNGVGVFVIPIWCVKSLASSSPERLRARLERYAKKVTPVSLHYESLTPAS